MAWVRIEGRMWRHPKVLHVGRDARELWLAAMGWSAEAEQDGFVPLYALPAIAADAGVKNPGKLVERLLTFPKPYTVGLFEEAPGGYLVHDYLDFNPSAAEIEAKRIAREGAGRAGGLASARSRRSKREANASPNPEANAKQTPKQNGTPVPRTPFPGDPPDGTAEVTNTPSADRLARVHALAVPKPGQAPGSPQAAVSRAMAEAMGIPEPKNDRRWSEAVTVLVRRDVTAAEMPRLVANYLEHFTMPLTAKALAENLTFCRNPIVGKGKGRNGQPAASKFAANVADFRALHEEGAL